MVKLNDKNVIELGTPKVISRGRCKYGVFIDTETCNMDKMIFDFSGKVINLKTGAIKEEFSFVIEDTYKTRNIITGQFSRKKRKDYPKLLRNGSYKMITRQELVNFLQELFTTYKIDVVGAFNIAFDLQALYNTLTYTNNRMKYFKKPIIQELEELEFFKVDMLDLWAFASIIFHLFYPVLYLKPVKFPSLSLYILYPYTLHNMYSHLQKHIVYYVHYNIHQILKHVIHTS